MSKQNQPKIADEAVEFLPDAIEIKNEKLPLWARYSVLFALAFFLAAVLWASLSKVDVVVKATGKITSDKLNIVMKPRESSVIKRLLVRVGDVVEKDQLLVTFDPTITKADVERIRREVSVLTPRYERFLAEAEGRPYEPKEDTPYTREQRIIYRQRQDYYQSRIRNFNEQLKQIEASRKSREDSLRNQEDRLRTVRKMEKMYDDLEKKKAATLRELWNIQISRMEMEGNIDTIKNALLELDHQREGTLSSRESFIHEWRNSVSENLISAGRELDSNRKQLAQASTMLSFVELRAPCRAVVHEIAPFPEGSAVGEAEALLTLIPIDGNLEVEASVEPRDIGKVHPGSEVRVKLSAFPFQKHGTLNGRVRNISEDTINRGGGAAAAAAATSGESRSTTFYRARISLGSIKNMRNLPARFRLVPGMEVEAEIKTGRRRIIEYIVYPLIKALDEAAREP